jgi:hypothetical protein
VREDISHQHGILYTDSVCHLVWQKWDITCRDKDSWFMWKWKCRQCSLCMVRCFEHVFNLTVNCNIYLNIYGLMKVPIFMDLSLLYESYKDLKKHSESQFSCQFS